MVNPDVIKDIIKYFDNNRLSSYGNDEEERKKVEKLKRKVKLVSPEWWVSMNEKVNNMKERRARDREIDEMVADELEKWRKELQGHNYSISALERAAAARKREKQRKTPSSRVQQGRKHTAVIRKKKPYSRTSRSSMTSRASMTLGRKRKKRKSKRKKSKKEEKSRKRRLRRRLLSSRKKHVNRIRRSQRRRRQQSRRQQSRRQQSRRQQSRRRRRRR